jgi:oligopeptide/dipeptide ABC transporter ATP-binding protein
MAGPEVTAALLEVENLRVELATRSGLVRAVDGVSFHVAAGETLGIVGESGCGKTMTALALQRMLPRPGGRISGGAIRLGGEDLLAKSEAEMRDIRGRDMAMILQDPMSSLNPVMTIGAQVAEPIRAHQAPARNALHAAVLRMLDAVRIPSPAARAGDYPHQMSGGMRQRVVGAIALSCRPRLLIADEPTTALDVTIQAQYLALLKDLQRDTGVALILITHDFGIVAKMCDRVAVMYAGRIVETADTRTLFARPAHPYTRALLEALPSMDNRTARLKVIDGQPPDLRAPPEGCRFAPRCALATAPCRGGYPAAITLAPGHIAHCLRAGEP